MSWRDETAQEVQDDLDSVVGAAIEAAEHFLAKNGEFFPFGVTVDDNDELAVAAADPGLGERPASAAVLDSLYEGVRGAAGRLRAAAFVADVAANGSDAIRVEAEHRDGGPALQVLTPYSWKGMRKKTLLLGQPSAASGEHRVWDPP